MLAILILIPTVWLSAAVLVVMLCRAAAHSDAEIAAQAPPTCAARPQGIGLWPDAPEPAGAELLDGDARRLVA